MWGVGLATLAESLSLPFTGSCHCGLIRVELLVPLQEIEIKEDNCSICARVSVSLYPDSGPLLLSYLSPVLFY